MKIILILFSVLFSCVAIAQDSGTLQIKIENLSSKNGNIRLALFDQPENFPKAGKEYRLYIFPLQAKFADIRLIDLPLKEFAIAVFHDENADGICNKNVVGIPTEGYGFSNNVFHRFRPPSFEESKFLVLNLSEIIIKMKN